MAAASSRGDSRTDCAMKRNGSMVTESRKANSFYVRVVARDIDLVVDVAATTVGGVWEAVRTRALSGSRVEWCSALSIGEVYLATQPSVCPI